ncbi:hypothetical protein [Mucilaginibacter psychrotolerans]|uniref:hypothetical protein n=1 Tax=Mucilaginibacter psychrotolerans TaxID=1524096 RepID=UPI0013052E36|nr:hypothetical protein [Mucilaginibacter psychrotolerans]
MANSSKKEIPDGIPTFMKKMMEDKRDIKEAIRDKKSLTELAKEKDIKLAKLI